MELVTEVAERKFKHPWKRVRIYNVFDNNVIYNPWNDFPELFNRVVHESLQEKADALSLALHALGPQPLREYAKPIVDELVGLCEKTHSEMSALERWDRTAYCFPQDIGGSCRQIFVETITEKSYGKVLEAMAGFNSYVNDNPNVSEVVALDFSKEMLKRYPYPQRKRIVFDLNSLDNQCAHIDFFVDNFFDTILCCYGVNYLEHHKNVFSEFFRITAPKGQFIVLGQTCAGYGDITTCAFDPASTAEVMQLVGYEPTIEHYPNLKDETEIGEYYIITGVKK